ncbi:MAG TPA: adenosylcobalamin-dependent ribonucleoside-diphosphate reductase, partial [Firmicutes bacterium]|nr:adenosylcobalamin-dependent ribonucleoside-diphosphate reductase [Bacillota bacterium]
KFDRKKIENAIKKASYEVLKDRERAERIATSVTEKVIGKIVVSFKKKIPTVEAIQDIVESVLMSEGYSTIAKSYILYRAERSKIRLAKSILGLKDDLKLPINTLEVLRRRYLLRDENGNIIETPSEMFRRVAYHIAQAEKNFKSYRRCEEIEEKFYQMMRNLEFLPNSPTLMNAGTSLGQLSACFVLPVEDSIEGIFQALKNMAKIHQTGGGAGFNFSNLRPKGDIVHSTMGKASGPVSFMSIFNAATEVIVQGGRRRGANMGVLRCDHPDILEFIEVKLEKDRFTNFNLSVGVTDEFMEAVKRGDSFHLINPRTGKKVREIKANVIFDLIVNAAWRTGDPGLIFLDEINRKNPLSAIGKIEATNPCGELPLLPYESCNLGSINLSKIVKGDKIDWEKLADLIHWAVRFLDDVIEVNKFPLPEIKKITLSNRKIGLGVMGFADMLIKLGIPYNSQKAVELAENLMRFIHKESLKASIKLAEERGVFPNYGKSVYKKKNLELRNATVNSIAPTGSISIIAGCSSGIEPLFAIAYVRNVLSGSKFFEINPIFQEYAEREGIFGKELIVEIARSGSLQKIKRIPEKIKRIFVTAFDIGFEDHLKIQAAFQKYTDNSVSKTINLPADATVDDVRKVYMMAYELKLKGITIYRYGSKEEQVLTFGDTRSFENLIVAESEYSGGCAVDICHF